MVEVAPKPAMKIREERPVVLRVERLTVRAGERSLFAPISVDITAGEIFGILGPSGAGKSTFLKCLNRLIDLVPQLRVQGEVRWHGQSIYESHVDVDALRGRVG